ncbi:MAG: hypothetical protein FJX90_05500 [Bacteroidetes bacterium]|nr:hypothetical protein [Bacteroidota bacterium]
MKSLLLTFLCIVSVSLDCLAQPDSDTKVIKLTNGNEYIGKIISDDGREILIETNNVGKIYLLKKDVQSISAYDPTEFTVLNNEVVKSTTFSTRYTFTTNALPLKKKDSYYMINLWGPEFHMTIADNFNIGVMSTWFASPIALAAKYSIPTKNPNVNFSVGEIIGSGGYIAPEMVLSLSFANITLGDRDKNITFAGGYLASNPNIGFGNPSHGPMGSIGAHVRISDKSSFIFDSMFGQTKRESTVFGAPSTYTTQFFLFMPGLRLEQGEGKAVQFCMAGASFDGNVFPFPYVTWFRKL